MLIIIFIINILFCLYTLLLCASYFDYDHALFSSHILIIYFHFIIISCFWLFRLMPILPLLWYHAIMLLWLLFLFDDNIIYFSFSCTLYTLFYIYFIISFSFIDYFDAITFFHHLIFFIFIDYYFFFFFFFSWLLLIIFLFSW